MTYYPTITSSRISKGYGYSVFGLKLDIVMQEINIYYTHYHQYNGKYTNLSDEDKYILEEEMWEKKAINNPVIFEERYGKFIEDVLGVDKFKAYKERRKISVGLFPRELI